MNALIDLPMRPGAGLGLRRELLPELLADFPAAIGFLEIAPENWAGQGGRAARQLRALSERYPLVCHGLSLSLGGPGALDVDLLRRIRRFMDEHAITLYTEHLAWTADHGQLYDLLPMPQTEAAVRWTAQRIRQAQDILGCRIGLENASTYLLPPGAELDGAEFIRAVIEEADCLLHLDVNNIYVNSRNFGFDAVAFLHALPLERTCYIHVAGHFVEPDGRHIDTHGAPVIDPVWDLLRAAYGELPGPVATCLERDFNIPAWADLEAELARIKACQAQAWPEREAA